MEQTLVIRMHKFGIVCPDAQTLKVASAIVQRASKKRFIDDDKRATCKRIQRQVKHLDANDPCAFEYMKEYPRTPFPRPLDKIRFYLEINLPPFCFEIR